jgi:hypothetical protein
LCSLSLILYCAKSGKKQADQDRNDRDHDKQFDESEGAL